MDSAFSRSRTSEYRRSASRSSCSAFWPTSVFPSWTVVKDPTPA